jgi:6-hydroxytryprostatin B O-methyltransferase
MFHEAQNGMTDSLIALSSSITKNAGILTQYLDASQCPQPSFEAVGPSRVIPSKAPQDVAIAQQSLIGAALDIIKLAAGPSEFLPNLAIGVSSQHNSFEA